MTKQRVVNLSRENVCRIVGHNVAVRRRALGLTQEEVSEAVSAFGVSLDPTVLSRIETCSPWTRGNYLNVGTALLVALSRVLNVEVTDLLEGLL